MDDPGGAPNEWAIGELVEALRLLAAPYPVQVASLPDWVAIVDEVALRFDDIFGMVPRADWAPEVGAFLQVIDAELAAMSGDPTSDVWQIDGLASSERWARIRELSLAALQAIGHPYRPPVIDQSEYVRGKVDWAESDE